MFNHTMWYIAIDFGILILSWKPRIFSKAYYFTFPLLERFEIGSKQKAKATLSPIPFVIILCGAVRGIMLLSVYILGSFYTVSESSYSIALRRVSSSKASL